MAYIFDHIVKSHLLIICCRDQRYMKYKYERKKTK